MEFLTIEEMKRASEIKCPIFLKLPFSEEIEYKCIKKYTPPHFENGNMRAWDIVLLDCSGNSETHVRLGDIRAEF